jgi:predicted RND superfamily exporter protein
MISSAYNAIQPYLAALGLSALGFGSVFLAAVAAVKWFGESWVIKVQNDFRTHHVFLLKNAIFMPSTMKTRFTAIGDLGWDALMEHKINHEMKAWGKRPKLESFEKLGDSMLLELEAEIQKRLWSDVPSG